jgi:peptidase E
MFQSGFDQAISSVHRAFVYGGESAGAVVTGPTLHGAQYMDNPDDAPEVVWNGLSIVNFGIVPHWGEAKYSKKLESIRDELAKYTEVIELRNAQAVVVRDGSVRVDT